MNFRTLHVSFSELADMAESGAPGRADSLAHLAACRHCNDALEELRKVVNLMGADKTEDAPRDAIARAVNVFRLPAERREPSRSIVASLAFDSFTLAPAYGVRSGQTATRQLIYSAPEGDLDLRISSAGDSWTVSGQVLGTSCEGGAVELRTEAGPASAAVLNELCEFTLAPVPAGRYNLLLQLADFQLEVPGLNLRA